MVLSFKKQDLDDASVDDRFPDTFRVDLVFSSSGEPVPAVLPSLSDGSLVTLSSSTPEDCDAAGGKISCCIRFLTRLGVGSLDQLRYSYANGFSSITLNRIFRLLPSVCCGSVDSLGFLRKLSRGRISRFVSRGKQRKCRFRKRRRRRRRR